ncbi:MAG TPA: aromatic-ring-hydroxylating dioxygenase subunit beta [Stellaceae bacterium]|nr:aromatic-ring-hydroxylating dioxygenase subunit beta [Stellaceae bacterium]
MDSAARARVERFLYLEARLMDEHRYKEWLALWAEDALYWVPCNEDDIDPTRHVSIIYDDRVRLEQRLDRLLSGAVLAQDPKPRMRRVLSNIEIDAAGEGLLAVQSNFVLVHARQGTQLLWAGRTIHHLRAERDTFLMRQKKVLLVNADQEMPLLQFLI